MLWDMQALGRAGASRHLPWFRSPSSGWQTLPPGDQCGSRLQTLVEGGQQPGQCGCKLRALFPRAAVSRNPPQALMGPRSLHGTPWPVATDPFRSFRATLGSLRLSPQGTREN